MPIQEQNIVFVESQVMDDVPEGGGAATGNVIPDGVMNNVFEDISDLDRAFGRFNLRKLFLAVRTLSTDLYGGATSVVTALPTDPAIGYTLFSTDDAFDVRTEAANRVESYLFKGPMWNGALNENHIQGMRSINVIQRVDSPLPVIGKTLCLVEDEGLAGEKEQYVRVIAVEATETIFTDDKGDYVRWIVRMDLSDALRSDFDGHTVNRYDQYNYTGKTRIRDTTVADAQRYYGSQPLAVAGEIGDLTVKAKSIFTQLVPSAQTETPLVNQILAGERSPMLASRADTLSYSVAGAVVAPNGRFVLDTGAYPGTINVQVGGVTITDDGAGNARYNSTTIGAWDYTTGECNFDGTAPSVSGTANVTYQPAAAVPQQAHTRAVAVTAENRRLNWTETLLPRPAASALSVAYRAQGNWYVLTDNGSGVISGSDPTIGTGTISYVTGDALVTLGALPDVGSQIMWVWASPVHTTVRVGDPGLDPKITVNTLLNDPIEPGSLVITWLVGNVTKTATVAASGVVSGDCTGYVSHVIGDIYLEFSTPPDPASKIGLDYNRVTQSQQTLTGVSAPGGIATLNLGGAIEPGSLELRWSTTSTVKNSYSIILSRLAYRDGAWTIIRGAHTRTQSASTRLDYEATDDGVGGIIDETGVVNYATGEITAPLLPTKLQKSWSRSVYDWIDYSGSEAQSFDTGIVNAFYTPAGAAPAAVSTEIDLPPLVIRLLPRLVDETAVAGSIRFRWNGQVYVDRNGQLFRAIDPSTGSGTPAGTMDYLSGEATLTDYVTGAGTVTIDALLGRFGDFTVVEASLRTAVAPLKTESLQLNATAVDGEQITGIADADGVIAGDWMRGDVNYEFGTAFVEFGELAGDPLTWTPREVDPGTIRYNAVAYSYIPLDADILGIDPVRLPPDGRVPIYRAGDVVMVLHSLTTAPATPTQTGGTGPYQVDCGRTRVGWVKVFDAVGDVVTDGYTLDRANGVVEWGSIAGLLTPVTVKHTVGDLRLVTDVQIDGTLTLARPLTHDFPADDTLVAACLIHGDRRARVSATWDQSSWDGTWQDSIKGSAATATLNLIDYPITVTNEGCDTDRWVLRWLTTTTAELISEKRGLVWSGSYTAGGDDIAPINPRTRDQYGQNGTPYIVIPGDANGGGWSAGNVVRINTVGAIADMWIARAIGQSDEPLDDGADGCEIYALGNVDRP